MYLFVYKTTHINGRYYIGRHQTDDLNDGYLGSGRWVNSIKDKSSLSREIITEAKSFEELCVLEEYYIDLHWDDPLCMNMKKASVGWSSEDVKNTVINGTNPFLKRPDGSSIASDKVKNGTHNLQKRPDGTSLTQERTKAGTNPFQTRPDGTNLQIDRVKAGIHHFLTRPDGTNLQIDRVAKGTHNLQKRPDGTSLTQERTKAGTNPFQIRSDGSSLQKDRIKAGTHHFLQLNNGNVACYNKQGEYQRISKDEFNSQSGPKEDWEWVGVNGKEGKRRKLLKQN